MVILKDFDKFLWIRVQVNFRLVQILVHIFAILDICYISGYLKNGRSLPSNCIKLSGSFPIELFHF
jgi:hypothetical protein